MTKHQIRFDQDWFNSRYAGEDADDGCPNELSLYRQADSDQLTLLLSNIDFAGSSHDNTYLLDKHDAQALVRFLTQWLDNNISAKQLAGKITADKSAVISLNMPTAQLSLWRLPKVSLELKD